MWDFFKQLPSSVMMSGLFFSTIFANHFWRLHLFDFKTTNVHIPVCAMPLHSFALVSITYLFLPLLNRCILIMHWRFQCWSQYRIWTALRVFTHRWHSVACFDCDIDVCCEECWKCHPRCSPISTLTLKKNTGTSYVKQ